jgi:hypothetical protein
MKNKFITTTVLLLLSFVASNNLSGQKANLARFSAGFPINYEEDSVGTYTLPDLLTSKNGSKITDAKTWNSVRRPELLAMIESQQFGKVPPAPAPVHYSVFEAGTPAFGGKAIRKQVTLSLTEDSAHLVNVLFYLPANHRKAVAVLLYINFGTNASFAADTAVKPGFVWTKDGRRILAMPTSKPVIPNIDKFLAQGIAVATLCYGDIEPDFKKGYDYGIRKYFAKNGALAADEWGAIAAWSWGLSRVMDYIETDHQMDAKRVALLGISRLGKTVLWTGARDTRFKLVIASCSGEGGAALSSRNYGENLRHITDTSRYAYQFAANYHSYASDVSRLPFDAHALVALMAPRPLLLQTGDTDYWSDPKGEFLSAIAAEPVYQLFGEKGPGRTIMPVAGDTSLLVNPFGYYMHRGGHGTIPNDWDQYLSFLKMHL